MTTHHKQWRRRGADVELLTGAQCQEYCGTDKIPSALLDLRCGTVNPFAYANALASTAARSTAALWPEITTCAGSLSLAA